MGAWSPAILGNDTSCEVYERFIELYNFGTAPATIESIVIAEQQGNLECDRTNVWIGLALACWECKVLSQKTLDIVKEIIVNGEDLYFNKELDADVVFLKQRSKNLDAFLEKISKEKIKARIRKIPPNPIESIYKAGLCMTYKNDKENYIGVYVTDSEHFKNKGSIDFCFLDFESKELPDINMFRNARLFGLKKLGEEWGTREYCGNIANVYYEKAQKAFFFEAFPAVFKIIGELRPPNHSKLVNNIRAWPIYDGSPVKLIDRIENLRAETKTKFEVSELTLEELLDKVGL